MADDSNKLSIKDFIEDDGTLDGLIRHLGDIIELIDTLEKTLKKDDVTKWMNGLSQGSRDYKIALQSATSLAKKLVATSTRLTEVRMAETKELARLEQIIKNENRERQREAEINSKTAGSYAKMKLELKQFVEQYKNATGTLEKSKLADSIILLSNELMLADKELKNLMNDYTKLSATEQARLATLERERAESNAIAEAIKKRAKAEAELNEVTKNRGAVESTALAEQMRKAIEERIRLEAKELILQDQFYAKELSSTEMIKQRLAIKEQLTQTEAKLKALEMQEANDLAIVKARVIMKQQQLDVEANIVAAESQEGRNLAENEVKLKRIQQQNERNAQIATAVAGSYEHMKLILQAKLDVLNNINRSQGVAFSNALAEVAAAQKQVAEAEAWINIVKQQANEQVKLNLLSDQEYQSMVQKNKELELEIKYTQGVVDSRAKLASIQKAATAKTESGRSQLEEIKYEEQLASAIQKTAAARAEAAAIGTQEYQEMANAQQQLIHTQLELTGGMKLEDMTLEEVNGKAKVAIGTYEQLEARYKLVEKAMRELSNSTDANNEAFNAYSKILDNIAFELDQMERKMGVTSSRMSSRQREWNGLTNSVYQLTRELPNLAVRADTFFLAISNNIPIFIDEFNRATKELGSFKKALAETGKAFAKSIPLALVLYALANWSKLQKLVDNWFNTLQDGSLKLSVAYRNISKEVIKVNDDMGKHIATLSGLASQWKKLSTDQERLAFLEEYGDEIRAAGYATNDLVDAERLFANITGLVVDAYMARGKAAAAMRLATEQYNEAISEQVKADEKASELAGRQVSRSQLGRTFFTGLGGEQAGVKVTASGKVTVPKEVYEQLANEYFYSMSGYYQGGSNPFDLAPYGATTAKSGQSELHKTMLAELQKDLKEYEVPEELMYIFALNMLNGEGLNLGFGDVGGKYDDLFKYAHKASQKMVQGSQYATMGYEYLNDAKETDKMLGISKADSEKVATRVLSLVNSVTKTMNDAMLGGMAESFDKQRKQAEASYEELLDTLIKKREEIEKLLRSNDLSEEQKEQLEGALSNVIQTWNYAYAQYSRQMADIARDEQIALLQAAKANIDNRLDSLKEGSEEELDLRKQSIRKAMQIEIAENAKLEPQLRRSVAAIRAKYQREEELAVREHFIKIANYRKKDLENEQAYVNEYTRISLANSIDAERINLQIELAENADLIEQGLISREAIIEKYNKKIEKIYLDHKAKILQAEKSYWDMMAEFVTDGSYEQLETQLKSYDLALEAEKLQYKELIEVMPEYGRMLDEIYAKRKRLAVGQYNLGRFDAQQDIDATIFGSRPQIGEQQQSIFDLKQEWARDTYQLELFDNGQLDLTDDQLDAIYADLRRIANEMKQITGWRGTVSRVADHGLAGLLQMPDMDDTGKRKKDANGKSAWRDLSSEEYNTVSTYMSNLKDSINGVMQAYIDLAQAAYDAAQAQVDAARTVYETELEARANGYANDVEGAKRELALEKQKAKQKEAILKQSQKAQEYLNTAMQVSDLITASAAILKAFAAVPAVAGIMLASMWGMFAVAKIKAAQVASQSSTYGGGGFELAVGGSHASGHDIHTNIQTKSGRQMVIEGGEGVGILSRKAVNQYGDVIPQVIDSFNDGSFGLSSMGYDDISAINNTRYAKEILSLQPVMNTVDLSTIEGLISVLISKQTGMPIVLQDGSLLERKGNKTIITKKG